MKEFVQETIQNFWNTEVATNDFKIRQDSKVAFTLRPITRSKMVAYWLKKNIFIFQMAKSTAYYAA